MSFIAALLLLGVCVFFHELGHFLAGKWVGVKAKVFSIGYGKGRIYKKIGRTIYQITAIPLGGYVKFYGDNISTEYSTKNVRKGYFFSVGPWKRIIVAAGGPFFSLLLGFIVIYILHVAGWQPTSNEVIVSNQNASVYSADKLLKNGDKIIAVNQHRTNSFEEISYYIGLSDNEQIDLVFEREGQILQGQVQGIRDKVGSLLKIGIYPTTIGQFLVVAKNQTIGDFQLKEADKLVAIDQKTISSFEQFRSMTTQRIGSIVQITLLRDDKEYVFPALVKKTEYINLEQTIINGKSDGMNTFEISSWNDNTFKQYTIHDKGYKTWNAFKRAILQEAQNSHNGRVTIVYKKKHIIEAYPTLKSKGIIGVSLILTTIHKKAQLATDPISLLVRTFDQTIFTVRSTLDGLYKMIVGKLSFREHVSGPVKIIDYARRSVALGWDVYWFLLANITIVLGIMNLLPIPVLDGGHIMFYLIEAIYKPLPTKIINVSIRLGMALLLSLGVYVLCIDIWDVVLSKLF